MKRLFPSIIPCLFLISVLHAQEAPSGERILSRIEYLASDALQGRDAGSPDYRKAAEWVADHFEQWNLTPAGDNGTYFQSYSFPFYESKFKPPRLKIDGRIFFEDMEDFYVPKYSGGGKAEGQVVFAGYGIHAPGLGLDEYDGVDVHGRIVLVMRGCPGNDTERWDSACSDSAKIAAAAALGARGMLVCRNFEDERTTPPHRRMRSHCYHEGFPVFALSNRTRDWLLKHEGERESRYTSRMQSIQADLDDDLQPGSFNTEKRASMALKVEFDGDRDGFNVLAKIEGSDPRLKDEYVLIGAHLDHLGVQYDEVYNGADDNASGVAVLMEAAYIMVANGIRPKRTVVFACWDGEEQGLLGSRHYAAHPQIPLDKLVVKYNLDMVAVGERLGFGGVYYAHGIWSLLQNQLDEELLAFLEPSKGGPGGSDHTPFIMKGIPAFFLITRPWWGHGDYHTPADDTEKCDAALMEKVARFLIAAIEAAANAETDLIQADRHVDFLQKYAVAVNPQAVPYESGMSVLDSLEDSHVDVQFVEMPADTGESGFVALTDLLDEMSTDAKMFDGSLYQLFSTRREGAVWLPGLRGAASVGSDLSRLRIAGKLGIRFFILEQNDGVWVDGDTLTSDGLMAVNVMNNHGMLILLENPTVSLAEHVMAASRHPVILQYSDDIPDWTPLEMIRKERNLVVLELNAEMPMNEHAARIRTLADTVGERRIAVYPAKSGNGGVDMKFLIQALIDQSFSEERIRGLLGEHFEDVMEVVFAEE